LLAANDPLEIIATEQFFLESFAMSIFEGLRESATHPLLRRIIELITRDESRHMGFGVLYIAEWLRKQPLERRIAFARPWLSQILGSLLDRPGPIFLARVVQRLHDAGMADADRLAPRCSASSKRQRGRARGGRREKVPHLLKSARRVGLWAGSSARSVCDHPLIGARCVRETVSTDWIGIASRGHRTRRTSREEASQFGA
jgi:hypothetical protein